MSEENRCLAHLVETSSVSRVWRENHLKPSTIRLYLGWVKRFYEYCDRRGREPESELTLRSVTRFLEQYSRQRDIALSTSTCRVALCALRAWSIALHALGRGTPCWSAPAARSALPLLLRKYWHYSQQFRGVAESTLRTETSHLLRFMLGSDCNTDRYTVCASGMLMPLSSNGEKTCSHVPSLWRAAPSGILSVFSTQRVASTTISPHQSSRRQFMPGGLLHVPCRGRRFAGFFVVSTEAPLWFAKKRSHAAPPLPRPYSCKHPDICTILFLGRAP